jgi:hypothetical protein
MSLLLTGYYNKKFIQRNPYNNYDVTPAWLQEYPTNVTIITGPSYRLPPVATVPNRPLFYEEYTWTTYEDEKLEVKLGSITYNSLYPDDKRGNISGSSIQPFTVLGADGIYEGITNVIMDFTLPQIRKTEFFF